MNWPSTVVGALAENRLLERLCFATLELLVASVLLASLVRWARFSSQRFVACLWLIVLMKPLMTLAVGSPIAVWKFDAPGVPVAYGTLAPALRSSSSVPSAGNPLEVPLDVANVGSASVVDAPHPIAANVTEPDVGRLDWSGFGLAEALLVAWCAGVLWCCVRYLLVRRRLFQAVRRAAPASEPIARKYAALARDLSLKRTPALRVTEDLDSPALVGLIWPTVLLPGWLVARGREDAIEWALRHELAHWRWLDPLAIFVRDIASIVFFFHPALPWATRRHAEAMEMACDWESLRDPAEAGDYAEGLCAILASMRTRSPDRTSALAMADHGRMARRIRALLDDRRARPLTPRSAMGTALLALCAFTFGCHVERAPEASGLPPVTSTTSTKASGQETQDGARSDLARSVDQPVLDGLRWLVRHQNADGSWSPTTLAERCPCEEPLYKPKKAYVNLYDEGVTGLALLCFLGAGFTDESTQDIADPTTGEHVRSGDVVRNGLAWLVARQNADGSFSKGHSFMYDEALASLALSEAYGATQSARWKEPAQKSVTFIQGAQRPSPRDDGLWGWRYASRQSVESFMKVSKATDREKRELYDSDTSVTSWCTMALASGVGAGLVVDKKNLDGALAFTEWISNDDGRVGYIDPKGAGSPVTGPNDHFTYHSASMSALGMCTRIFTAHDPDDPFLKVAANQVVKDLPTISENKLSIDYYYWYFGTLALSQLDGSNAAAGKDDSWTPWSKAVVESLLALQDHTPSACTNGGWMVGDRWSYASGPLYTTAMNVLTLEIVRRSGAATGSAHK